MVKVIEDEGYRERLVENGKKNCLRFSEERIADQYYEVYRRIAGE